MAPLVFSPTANDERVLGEAHFRSRLRRATRILVVALLMPILVLLGLVGFLYNSAKWVDHTDQVISNAYRVEKLVVTIQMGFRGYRLTGDAKYLQPYLRSRRALTPEMDALARRIADNPAQVRRMTELRSDVGRCLAFFDRELDAISQGRTPARDAGFIVTSAPVFDNLQAVLGSMVAQEESLRAAREAKLERWVVAVLTLLALAAIIGIPLIALSGNGWLRSVTRSYREAHAEAEFRASELAVTLRSIGDAVITTDVAGRVIFLNPVAEELTGWSATDARGRPLLDVFRILNEYTREPVENPVERVLRENVVVGLMNHTVLCSRDGRERAIEDSAAPIRNDQGQVRGVILVFHDVSTKREKEKLLEQSDERFRVLHTLSERTKNLIDPVEIMIIATEVLGQYLRASRCAYAEVAEDGEQFEILHDYTQGCATTMGRYRLSSFGAKAVQTLSSGERLVVRDVRAELGADDGGAMFLQLGIQAIVCVPLIKAGVLRAMMAVHQSVPRRWSVSEVALIGEFVERCWATIERARAEGATEAANVEIAAAAERFRLLAHVVSLQVWTATVDGKLDYANQECAQYLGADVEREVLGDGWRRYVHPQDLPAVEESWASSIASGDRYEIEFRLRAADGSYRWFIVRSQAMRDSGGAIVKWFGTNTDIDALKRAQAEAERASRSKDEFIATLSHELRTPLTPVLMMASAMREDGRLPEDLREQLSMIERNIALEARLIDDLLDVTAIAKGKLQLRAQLSDVHSLIGLAVEIVRDDAQRKEITIDQHLMATRSGSRVDPARFQQVIWNLLRNAVKFTARGGRVSIETRNVDGPDGSCGLQIQVRDSGIGFSESERERIFRPFEQGARTGDHRFGGLGLGLSIARAIVDLHGGTIAADSAGVNLGAAFTITLPDAVQPPGGHTVAQGALSTRSVAVDGFRPAARLKLLLVEDHEATLHVLSRLLTGEGHAVTTARSVGEALERARVGKFDFVVSDLGLPDGTGAELMQQLRQAYQLRGIALSGYGMDEDLGRSREAGFVAHLIKPVDFRQLRRVLTEASR